VVDKLALGQEVFRVLLSHANNVLSTYMPQLHDACNIPDQWIHNCNLGSVLGASFLARRLAGFWVQEVKFALNRHLYYIKT
jgi:hypothetical protein